MELLLHLWVTPRRMTGDLVSQLLGIRVGMSAVFGAAEWKAHRQASEPNTCFFYGVIKGPSVQ